MRSSEGGRRLPVAGWDGRASGPRRCRSTELPRTVDPSAGYVMTANNAIVDGDAPYLSYTFAQPFRAERLRSLLDGAAAPTADCAGRDAGGHGLGRGAGLGAGARRARAVRATRTPSRPGRCWPGSTATSRPGRRRRCCTPASSGRWRQGLYRPILGADTWDWVASGSLAPTISLIRRWLGSDTWELLGMPPRPRLPAGRLGGRTGGAGAAGERGGGCSRRCRPRSPRPGRRRSGAGGRDPAQWRWGDAHQAVRVHPLGAADGGPGRCRACRWAATPTRSRRPGTAGGRAPRSPSPACRSTGRWWTWPTAGRPAT